MLLEEQNCFLYSSLSCQGIIWCVRFIKIASETVMVASHIAEH